MIKVFDKCAEVSLEEAIESIYSNSLYYAKNYIQDDQLAEDILHDVLEKILRNNKYKEFDSINKFYAYINISVRNKFLDEIRSRKTNPVKKYNEETTELIFKLSKSDLRADQQIIDDENDAEREINKVKINSAKSHLTPIQYLVVTLRANNYSFKQISEITGVGISTSLARMRYSKRSFTKQFNESRVKERRRKRFREGREGTFDYEDLLLKLPPYQYFAIKMKPGNRFKDIAILENVPESTVYYRFKLAKKNLKKMVKSDEDYIKIIAYIDSLNTNVGGRNWHKNYIKK